MCCYGQLVTNLVQLDLSVSLFSIFSFQLDPFSRVLSLQCHGLQHARLPYPLPTLGAYSSSCPSTWWCHPTISFCLPLLFLPSIFPSIRVFSNESALQIRWPKCWIFSFSISSSVVIHQLFATVVVELFLLKYSLLVWGGMWRISLH